MEGNYTPFGTIFSLSQGPETHKSGPALTSARALTPLGVLTSEAWIGLESSLVSASSALAEFPIVALLREGARRAFGLPPTGEQKAGRKRDISVEILVEKGVVGLKREWSSQIRRLGKRPWRQRWLGANFEPVLILGRLRSA